MAARALETSGLSVSLADLVPRENARRASVTLPQLEQGLRHMGFEDKRRNGLVALAVGSGAKGSAAHVYQCTVRLGQQLRAVSHGSDGMIQSWFGTGLTVAEDIVHAARARTGLLNTALQTKTVR